jgi:methyl-accepting chemotaxis protein
MQLASLLLLTLLTTTLLALFAFWSLNRSFERTERILREEVETLETVRGAQIHFKLQVQEWKNLLLRGKDPLQRVKYYEAFNGEERRVSTALAELHHSTLSTLTPADRNTFLVLQSQHLALGERYRAALEQASGGRWDTFVMDQTVRGIDRPLNTAIDGLGTEIKNRGLARFRSEHDQLSTRYQQLNKAMWFAMVLALVTVSLLLWRVLRGRAATE